MLAERNRQSRRRDTGGVFVYVVRDVSSDRFVWLFIGVLKWKCIRLGWVGLNGCLEIEWCVQFGGMVDGIVEGTNVAYALNFYNGR